MAQGNCAILTLAVALVACSDTTSTMPTTESAAIAESVRPWIATLDDEQGPAAEIGDGLPPVGDMIDGLRRRLEAEPNDLGGWRLLAQSYAYIGARIEARAAAERAIALGANPVEMNSIIEGAHAWQ